MIRPTLFICGSESPHVPVTDHGKILETFPGSQFIYVPGAGHAVPVEKPKEVMELIVDYLR